MPVQVVENTTLGEVTPQRGEGALGTVMAMRVTPQGTLSPVLWSTEPMASGPVNQGCAGCM